METFAIWSIHSLNLFQSKKNYLQIPYGMAEHFQFRKKKFFTIFHFTDEYKI